MTIMATYLSFNCTDLLQQEKYPSGRIVISNHIYIFVVHTLESFVSLTHRHSVFPHPSIPGSIASSLARNCEWQNRKTHSTKTSHLYLTRICKLNLPLHECIFALEIAKLMDTTTHIYLPPVCLQMPPLSFGHLQSNDHSFSDFHFHSICMR